MKTWSEIGSLKFLERMRNYYHRNWKRATFLPPLPPAMRFPGWHFAMDKAAGEQKQDSASAEQKHLFWKAKNY